MNQQFIRAVLVEIEMILGENNTERAGNGLFGNPYGDSGRPKGRIYEASAVGVQDADGNWVAERDTEGNIVYADIWLSPQLYGYDGLSDQARFVYDASYVKLREVVFGYTFPPRVLKKLKNIKLLKISLVGRDLWTIYRNTPQGIDPESGTTSGNGQGIEFGSFLPTRTVGVTLQRFKPLVDALSAEEPELLAMLLDDLYHETLHKVTEVEHDGAPSEDDHHHNDDGGGSHGQNRSGEHKGRGRGRNHNRRR